MKTLHTAECRIIAVILVLVLALTACAPAATEPEEVAATEQPVATEAPVGMANPASVNCVEQGGTLSIEKRPDGGEFGVCMFEDNLQCEEWALLRGECPVGGVKVTGYATTAARYCAITGGSYAVTADSGTETEQGTCTFADGSQCDAGAYFSGTCAVGENPAAASGPAIVPLTMEVCDGQAQAMSHFLYDLIPTQSEEPLTDFATGITGLGCMATITGDGTRFESPAAVDAILDGMLKEQGWTEDIMMQAGGPTGIGRGYRKDNQICQTSAIWWPAESANCPDDQPVSACPVTPEQQLYTVTLNCGQAAP